MYDGISWKGRPLLPPDALPAGNEADGPVLYSALTWIGGGVHIGKYVYISLLR